MNQEANMTCDAVPSRLPLVTIGLPVFNGMAHLRSAVESLLRQSYANLELVICDNASTDGTSNYCQALAKVHPHVRYVRQERNIGPLENFARALAEARGEYFMWASHDDHWSPAYVASLSEALARVPDAVLATPAVIHICEDGSLCSEPPDRPASGASREANLRRLFADHAASWIFGLWRTGWVRKHFDEYRQLPYWGADVLWLADICQRHPIVGNQDAVIFKRLRRSRYAPQNARQTIVFWAAMFWHISRACFRNQATWAARARVLSWSWAYVYRLGIRRPHLLRTAWRVVRMTSVAAITSVPLAIGYAWKRLTRRRIAAPA
ncbi:MAG TPA: glycosyltransferase family 2 protein [Pirellulales bacterium]|jgi:glycosyltransferase involved in cell wall biosynthesis|nr:glycosyltransferase family 2 protein [Pirellulales bacterium]